MLDRIRVFLQVLLLTSLVFLTFPLQASMPLEPSALLQSVRQQQAVQEGVLFARLREKSNIIPFRIVRQREMIRYEFSNPDQTLLLKLGEKSSELWEQKGAKSPVVAASSFSQPVRGTSITYEDLAFRFLYWPNPAVIGEDNLRTRSAWILQILSPLGQASRYGMVRLWIDKESGALLRMEGLDRQGRRIKRFEVVSAQKVNGRWLLKEMRIEELDPATGKAISRAYLSVSLTENGV